MRVKELFAWIKERHSIKLKKEAGKPKPWTKDPILQSFRFCNVHREDDKVTRWIAQNWRDTPRNITVPHLWFAMAVARLINLPESLEELGFPVPWRPERFIKVLHARRARGEKMINAAYVISTNGRAMDKVEYLASEVLTPLWANRAKIMPRQGDTLEGFAERLQTQNGFAGFMTGQVVADTKFTGELRKASDWWTWAVSGPGSRRGLNRVVNENGNAEGTWKESVWWDTLHHLQAKIDPLTAKAGIPRISAQDLQNCLCEFDKYERMRLGESEPKQKYPGV
jgi:hypothetical protein